MTAYAGTPQAPTYGPGPYAPIPTAPYAPGLAAPYSAPVLSPYPTGPAQWPAPEPLFSVRLMKHTGLAVMFLNQRYTVTGTFAQCEAAIRLAQNHNLTAGWWSVASLAVWNWVALGVNASARGTLRKQANAAFGFVPATSGR
jgi:hypothetical protein